MRSVRLPMDLPSRFVYSTLTKHGSTAIHHANSVLTSCHFIREKALLARGSAEAMGKHQTPQDSDEIDKRHSIWFDVFADSVDIHKRASRRNSYGPVNFVLDVALIEKAYTGRVWITKLNPTKWNGKNQSERWFQSRSELDTDFSYGNFDHMVVFRHCGGRLPFGTFLKEIILDDPQMKIETGEDLYSVAWGALSLALTDARLNVPITKRTCKHGCKCRREYAEDPKRTHAAFVPAI